MEVSIFTTCLVDQFFPTVGVGMVRVLRRLGIQVRYDPRQTCCGQPCFNTGYRNEARPLARRLLELFESSDFVVTPSGSLRTVARSVWRPPGLEDALAVT